MSRRNAPAQRFYDLDALRAVAMFLGIVLHATIFVLPEPTPLWPIYDESAGGETLYQTILEGIHGFRMPVFFLLSGFFTALLWQRRGLRPLAMQRLQRIGIPFIVACFTVLPLTIWVLQIIGGGVEPYDFPLWILPLVWLVGTLGHLWFLWYLLLMLAGFLGAARAGLQFRHSAWWSVIPLSLVVALFMVEPIFGADNAPTIIPALRVFFFYACFFAFGVFFYRQGITVRRWWTVALIPSAVLFWTGFMLLEEYLAAFGGSREEAGQAVMLKNNLTLFATLLETAFAWLMCFGLMGFFRWVAFRESFPVRYLSDASYWMYLMHVPLVIIAQNLVLGLSIHYHLKFLLVLIGVSLVLLITYQLGVRYTVLGTTLNGPRTRRPPRLAARSA